jgi:hypothetical protein
VRDGGTVRREGEMGREGGTLYGQGGRTIEEQGQGGLYAFL